MAKTDFKTIDEYQATCAPELLERMQAIRAVIHEVVPGVEETISYQIPCFKYKGYLVYYAAFANHISLSNPFSQAFLNEFAQDLKKYKVSKSIIQFPNKESLPLGLIKRMVEFRKMENEELATKSKK